MTRGGFRAGSGRKSSWNNSDTQLIRVPRIFAAQLLSLARRLDAGELLELPIQPMELQSGAANVPEGSGAESIEPETLAQMAQEILADSTVVRNPTERDAAKRALSVFVERLVQ